MPAAAWAARSGDASCSSSENEIPPADGARARGARAAEHLRARARRGRVREGRAPARPLRQRRAGSRARTRSRTRSRSPATRARGDFGWGANVPGFNFSLASTQRPLDLAAGAALGTNGVFAPLLAHRQGRPAAAEARRLLPRRPAGLRGRPARRGLQPRLDPRRHEDDLARGAGPRSTRSPRWCPVECPTSVAFRADERVRAPRPRPARADDGGPAPAVRRLHPALRAAPAQPDPAPDRTACPRDHPVRVEGEREIARLDQIAFEGERRGKPPEPGMKPMPSHPGLSRASAGRGAH